MTLWGKTSEDFDASSHPIVALKGVKLSDFGGRSLGSISSTLMQVNMHLNAFVFIDLHMHIFKINPDIQEAHKLRGWFDNDGSSSVIDSISSSRGSGGVIACSYKTFAEANIEKLGTGLNPDYYDVNAMVVIINKERSIYMACPAESCNKKVYFYH